MEYILLKRFKGRAICGEVDLPAKTVCQAANGVITHEGKPLCVVMSANAHHFFARNDDGRGLERGRLTSAITKMLCVPPEKEHYTETEFNERQELLAHKQQLWDRVWEDEVCKRYKRPEYADHWLWNHAFYNADIKTLKHIAKLIGA